MVLTVSIACGVLALLCAGVIYQRLGAARDRRRFLSQGRLVEINNGVRLFVRHRGAGGPAVIFEAGIAATSLNWQRIQNEVSRFTETVSYDRGGLGWSSPCRTSRTPTNVALELHSMLARAGVIPPYVLVGHSFGGLAMRRFASLFPEETASLVLIDPMRCDEWPPVNEAKREELDRGKKMSRYAVPIARVGLARLGITSLLCGNGAVSRRLARLAGNGTQHVLFRVATEVAKLPPETLPVVAAHWSRPGFYRGMQRHLAAVPETVKEMVDAEPLTGTPVLVLTPDSAKPLSWQCLTQIGDNVKQVIVPDSAHWIHLDQPEMVVELIRETVEETRQDGMVQERGRSGVVFAEVPIVVGKPRR